MILYKTEPFQFKMLNTMMLDAATEEYPNGVVYVSKNTYDQATVLYDRFEGERGTICKLLGIPFNDEVTVAFHEEGAQPLNVLAPFLGLLNKKIKVDKEDISVMYGFLHILSQIINFNGYMRMPEEARADLSVGRAILMSYKESWKDLEQTLADLVPQSFIPSAPTVVYQQAPTLVTPTVTVTSEVKEVESLDDLDDVENEEDWLAMMDKVFEEAEEEAAKEMNEAVSTPEPSAVKVSTAPTLSDEEISPEREKEEEELNAANNAIADKLSSWAD